MNVPILGIFTTEPHMLHKIHQNVDIKPILVDKGTSEEIPKIIYDNGIVRYKSVEEITGFDFMEWISVNDTVYFELTGLQSLFFYYDEYQV